MPNWKSYESSVRLLAAIVAAHPELKLSYAAICRMLNDDTTAAALEHRFRPIKKDAEAMKKAAAIATSYGEGASGKAVSTYFERLKKDPQWNLANTIAENAGGGGSAKKAASARKPRATPKGKKGTQAATDFDSEDVETPSKKGGLNKVASGRVTKARGAAAKKTNYAENSDEDDDEETIKNEPEPEGFADIGSQSSGMNGGGNSYSKKMATSGKSNGVGNDNGHGRSFNNGGHQHQNYPVYHNSGRHADLNTNAWSGGNGAYAGEDDGNEYYMDPEDGDGDEC